ncbi:hypothetical protein QR680_012316 [Steinernema hermaphroditum]|uniref:SKP1 component POZ domain-containing protein n=1 Tax=Steinernema hermaphroditum TaxID=289476 RepID=A0AA39M0B7_9BILA|nr:hypothetical protein QR680_012316 [Steinernema hermaphroditum]
MQGSTFQQVQSSDGMLFDFKLAWMPKCLHIQQRYTPGSERTPIVLEGISSDSLHVVLEWLHLHEDEEPKTEQERQMDVLSREDAALLRAARSSGLDAFQQLYSDVVDLEMPDFHSTMLKYLAENFKNKSEQQMSEWFGTSPKASPRADKTRSPRFS